MIIFIPVIIICMNGTCEFMQGKTYYHTEAECRASLDIQKQYMRNIIEQAGSSKIEHLESTCIDADVKTRTRTEVGA
jgi:hypothetical protein